MLPIPKSLGSGMRVCGGENGGEAWLMGGGSGEGFGMSRSAGMLGCKLIGRAGLASTTIRVDHVTDRGRSPTLPQCPANQVKSGNPQSPPVICKAARSQDGAFHCIVAVCPKCGSQDSMKHLGPFPERTSEKLPAPIALVNKHRSGVVWPCAVAELKRITRDGRQASRIVELLTQLHQQAECGEGCDELFKRHLHYNLLPD
jgi:hypothetical protein